MALNSTLIKSTGVAALGGLLFGFDTAVIAGATSALTSAFQLTPGGLGLTVSIALWGTVVGALCAGIPGDLYGRRDSLRGLAILYLVSDAAAFVTDHERQLYRQLKRAVNLIGISDRSFENLDTQERIAELVCILECEVSGRVTLRADREAFVSSSKPIDTSQLAPVFETSRRSPATIDHQLGAGHKRRLVTREEHHAPAHFFRLGSALH